ASAPDAITIALDPGTAFGTGLHPTTQQCLEAVSYMDVEGLRVLDVGTGSGILAIAAAKRGAREVVGVDTDPLAVRAAKENAEANGVTVDARPGSAENVDGAFDVVLANLVGPVLVQVAPHLRARLRPSGSLVAAGITTQAERDVLSAFVAEGLGIVDRDERSDWVRLVMTAWPTGSSSRTTSQTRSSFVGSRRIRSRMSSASRPARRSPSYATASSRTWSSPAWTRPKCEVAAFQSGRSMPSHTRA